MQAAAPKPEDRLAFSNQLANIRAKDVEGKYKKQLNGLEVEYQFILLRSLDLFHKEMLRAKLPESLHFIKEKLTEAYRWKSLHIKPTFLAPTGIGTTQYAAIVATVKYFDL